MASVFQRDGGRWAARWTEWVPTPGGWVKRRRTTAGTHGRAETLRLGRKLEDESRARMLAGDSPAAALAREAAARPLAEHLADYRLALEARGTTAKHRADTVRDVSAVADAAGWTQLADLGAAGLTAYLAGQAGRGLADRTIDRTRIACRMFARWAVGDGRLLSDPFARVAPRRVVERARTRRALSADELVALYLAAESGPSRFHNSRRDGRLAWHGPERAMTWRLCADCGLRASEARYVVEHPAECLDLDERGPSINLPAVASKHREADHLPIHHALAALLRPYAERAMAGRTDGPDPTAMWYCPRNMKPALAADLAAARAAYLAAAGDADELESRERSDFCRSNDRAGRLVDVHALRHTYVSHLAAAGVAPRMLQRLARHRDVATTLKHYAHLDESEARRVIDAHHDAGAAKHAARPAHGHGAHHARTVVVGFGPISATPSRQEQDTNAPVRTGRHRPQAFGKARDARHEASNTGGGTRTPKPFRAVDFERASDPGSDSQPLGSKGHTNEHDTDETGLRAELDEIEAVWHLLEGSMRAAILTIARAAAVREV